MLLVIGFSHPFRSPDKWGLHFHQHIRFGHASFQLPFPVAQCFQNPLFSYRFS
ncbi:hypothetical protein CLOSTMETH_03868 [[Clostridium] methylpentosum DSM 5476]|uniref:Uncharacterized protein n=1 Tax=[Clostridium] methylpentosum DSM 5476 TaxID=537013 RepID=C0EJ22_9FIRM|nr:hypothetical protein CLOSTMETH_03868 [[Clostridium] methylpentosum DSM 5476]